MEGALPDLIDGGSGGCSSQSFTIKCFHRLLCLSLNNSCALHGNGSQKNLSDVIYSNLERMLVQRPKRNGFSLINARVFVLFLKPKQTLWDPWLGI